MIRLVKLVVVVALAGGMLLPLFCRPTVFWVSDPIRPDDTLLVAGAGFGDDPAVHVVALPAGVRAPPAAADWPEEARATLPVPVQTTEESLKVVIPAGFSPGVWLARIEDRGTAEISVPFRINAPTVYWLQGDEGVERASPGGWLRLFGRCLGGGATDPVVMLTGTSGADSLELDVLRSSLWDVAAKLPEDLSVGDWEVWVHNGQGGALGWTMAGHLHVTVPVGWPDKVFNVRDYGAMGRADYADLTGIQSALDAAAENGGGVVYLPRGRYLFEGTLHLPRFTTLKGEGEALSCMCWPDTEEPGTLIRGTDHFSVQDLTLYASNYVHGIEGDLRTPEAGHVSIRNVTMRAVIYRGHLEPVQVDARFRTALKHSTGGGDTIRLGGRDVVVENCDLYGSGRAFYLFEVRGGVVRNNRFYNGRWGWYCITGADGLVYENNVLTGADLMSTGGGINCLGSVYSRNVYYARNTVARCHGWDREAMTTDAGGGAYHGQVASVEDTRLVLAGEASWRGTGRWAGAAVFVLGGRGMGQYRRIEAVADDGRSVVLERPWQVEPDHSSIITITMLHENYIFAENHFEDAGIGLQYYGTSINHVAWGNTSTRAGGFYNSGRWYRHYQPSWYCQFLENRIDSGNCYRFGPNNATAAGPSFIGTYGLQRGDNKAPLAYCATHRRNTLENNAQIRLDGVSDAAPGLRDVIVEHNVVEHTDVALDIRRGCIGVLCRENRFRDVDHIRYDPERARAARMARRQGLMAEGEPVYRQTFDKRSGRFLPDASGHHFTGVARGGKIARVPGVEETAGRFDGHAFLEVADRGLLRFPELTLAAWVWPDQLKGRWGVIAKRKRNGASAFVLALNNGGISFEATDVLGKWSYNLHSRPVLKPNQWNHVAVTCREAERVAVYCNGVEVAAKSVTEALVDNNEPLTVGYEAWGGPNRDPRSSGNFRGLIDGVSMWSRILSPKEIHRCHDALAGKAEESSRQRREAERQSAEEARRAAERFALPPDQGWTLVAAETFYRGPLDDAWMTLRGSWTVDEGVLRSTGVSILALRESLEPPVRIEFDGRSLQPSDLSGFFGTQKDAFRRGYFIGFASNGNTVNKILRNGAEVAKNESPHAVPERWHHVVCEIGVHGDVVLSVDGERILTYKDAAPVAAADTAGIIAWGEAMFDNLRIYTRRAVAD